MRTNNVMRNLLLLFIVQNWMRLDLLRQRRIKLDSLSKSTGKIFFSILHLHIVVEVMLEKDRS